jgi:hypothetical protein
VREGHLGGELFSILRGDRAEELGPVEVPVWKRGRSCSGIVDCASPIGRDESSDWCKKNRELS